MNTHRTVLGPQVIDSEWIAFPGGELEGLRPKILCSGCRERVKVAADSRLARSSPSHRPLCFACHRASLEHDRALEAAGQIDTASEARFQSALPFEPVNRARLARLRAARATARVTDRAGVGGYVDKRRQAQIAAPHALDRIVVGLHARRVTQPAVDRVMSGAVHAAELQLPDAWLPFVVSR